MPSLTCTFPLGRYACSIQLIVLFMFTNLIVINSVMQFVANHRVFDLFILTTSCPLLYHQWFLFQKSHNCSLSRCLKNSPYFVPFVLFYLSFFLLMKDGLKLVLAFLLFLPVNSHITGHLLKQFLGL
jgi:hypothetical protein